MIKKIILFFSIFFILFSPFITNIFNLNIEENKRKNASIKIEGEIEYRYHLPIKKGTKLIDAIYLFGLKSTSNVEELYIKISRSWHEIERTYVIFEDSTFKVGKIK